METSTTTNTTSTTTTTTTTYDTSLSYLLPTFLRRIADPSIKTVMMAGCGGGFDFVHSMNIYPELRRLQKEVILVSYSFGDVKGIRESPVVWEKVSGKGYSAFTVTVKEASAASQPDRYYAPEVHVASFLDSQYPQTAPHKLYACNGREFTVPLLHEFYSFLVKKHSVDAFIIFDGGSDSLMRGDEEGLGDPIEDCVSVTTVSKLEGLKAKILISAGFGADRYNQVSDASSLRAVAELTAYGGFLGSLSLEATSPGFVFYCNCVKHIYAHQKFRSVLTGLIICAAKGYFGFDLPKGDNEPPTQRPQQQLKQQSKQPQQPQPQSEPQQQQGKGTQGVTVDVGLQTRVEYGGPFLWPLMAMMFAFDVDVVAERSYISNWIGDKTSIKEMYEALSNGRKNLLNQGLLRDVENIPRHEELRAH